MGGNNVLACNPYPDSGACSTAAVYGAVGEPSAANVPGGRNGAAGWTDNSGNFWLFAGFGTWPGATSTNPNSLWAQSALDDLWEFSASTNEWTWEGGQSAPDCAFLAYGCEYAGAYGTLGSLTPGAISGSRVGAASWSGPNSNLWLFGGNASFWGPDSYSGQVWSAPLDDLWEFNPSTGEWNWVNGSSGVRLCPTKSIPLNLCPLPGVYGALGVAASGQHPGSRIGAATWTDLNGNLWMFGGQGWDGGDAYSSGPPPAAKNGYLNDLWEFNPSARLWTWMGGVSDLSCTYLINQNLNVCGNPGVYGSRGLPAAGNQPGGRESAATWTDGEGNFWLFGGAGIVSPGGTGVFNDLWKFNPGTKEWTWIAGPATSSQNAWPVGVYGTQGVPAAGNVPGAREGSVSWIDPSGDLWLFGGGGVDARGSIGLLNDLWRFDPRTITWTWMSGSSKLPHLSTANNAWPGVYGTLGASAGGNVPGGRENSVAWTDSGDNLWLFGGLGDDSKDVNGLLNDLWKYQIPQVFQSSSGLAFGNLGVGTASASQSAYITNLGAAALPIVSMSLTGANTSSFVFTNNCPKTLALNASCTITGHFAPQVAGVLTAAITINDAAAGSPQTLALSGIGLNQPAALSSPAPGSTLVGSSVQFSWSAVVGATDYELWVGTTGVGSSNLNYPGLATDTSETVSGLPTNAPTLYVRLFTKTYGVWQSNDYTYTGAGLPPLGELRLPAPGSTLTSSSVSFTWLAGTGATEYELWAGTKGAGSSDVYYPGLTTATTETVTGLPGGAVKLFVRLYSKISGAWQYNDYTYTAM